MKQLQILTLTEYKNHPLCEQMLGCQTAAA